MTADRSAVLAPADARLLLGSLKNTSLLFLKGKFFDFEELLGTDKPHWLQAFRGADYVICRLTPDKYHYNHTPVAGLVRDFLPVRWPVSLLQSWPGGGAGRSLFEEQTGGHDHRYGRFRRNRRGLGCGSRNRRAHDRRHCSML